LTPPKSQSSGNAAQKSDNDLALRAEALSGYAGFFSNLFELYGLESGVNELRDAVGQADYARGHAAATDFDAAREQLEQADENIYKALNDAVAFIGAKTRSYAENLGHANLNEHFGHYQELLGLFGRIERQFANEREGREQRDELYRYMAEGADFKDLLNYFDELGRCEIAIRASMSRNRTSSRRNFVIAALNIVLPPATLVSLAILGFPG